MRTDILNSLETDPVMRGGKILRINENVTVASITETIVKRINRLRKTKDNMIMIAENLVLTNAMIAM